MNTRCLLVDDNEDFLASATRLLESQGLDVVGRARSSAEALDLVERLTPYVALVDIELAEEDGITLSHQLHARAPGTRIVLISAYEREDLADLLGGSSAAGFVPKRILGADAIAAVLAG